MILLRFFLFFSLTSLIVTGSTYYLIKKRLVPNAKRLRSLRVILGISGLLMIVGPIQFRQLHGNVESSGTFILQFSQYFMMGWIGVTLIILLAAEFLQFNFRLFDPSKRIFLTEGVVKGLLATAGLASIGGWIQLKAGPKVERVTIILPTLPKAFDGFTIAQISDVHIGPILHKDFLDGVVEQTLELNADLIALTGDLVDGDVTQIREHVRPFEKLKAPQGTYFITGNHEYYSGADEWIAHWESVGIHVFKNSNLILEKKNSEGQTEKLLLGGVFDIQGERFSERHKTDPMKAAETSETVSCKILLAHNPKSIQAATEAGFHLQLSGHTHAGQFYPFAWIVRFVQPYFEGLYRVNEKTQIYVNRGTGFWGPPNRLGKTSEITLITLRSS